MKPAPFEYYAPSSVEESLELLERYGEDCKVLAGGQSLIPMLNLRLARPRVIVDINRIPGLDGIQESAAGLIVGALARQRAVEQSPAAARSCPLLAMALRHVAHPTIRNRGSVGGSLVHADPAAELPGVLVALDGEVRLRSHKGERVVPALAFFKDLMTTDIRADELLTEVMIPRRGNSNGGSGCAFVEVSRRYGDFAIVGAAALLTLDAGGKIHEARLAFAGVGPTPVRARGAEALLTHQEWSDSLAAEAADAAVQGLEPPSDLHASARYRLKLARVLGERALATAFREAAEGPR